MNIISDKSNQSVLVSDDALRECVTPLRGRDWARIEPDFP